MILGFIGLIISSLILIITPQQNYWMLIIYSIMEACSFPVISTLMARLIVINVDAKERARIMAVLNGFVLIVTSPFGWFSGQLSEVNRRYPFFLSIMLYILGILLTYLAGRPSKKEASVTENGFVSAAP